MIYNIVLYSMWGLAVLVFISLFFITAPYGQHVKKGWGPMLNDKLAWVLMELPAPVGMFVFFIIGSNKDPVAIVFFILFELHYCQRTFIFPFLMRGKREMPLSIVLFGDIFNFINAFLQGQWIFEYREPYALNWFFSIPFIVGVILFFVGFFINLQSDHIIRNLRQPGDSSFKIPRGGMYKYISNGNYFGEILEWIAWAIMTWSLPGLTFGIWTMANLVPRARTHHLWYQENFEDYPKNRKILFPFLW